MRPRQSWRMPTQDAVDATCLRGWPSWQDYAQGSSVRVVQTKPAHGRNFQLSTDVGRLRRVLEAPHFRRHFIACEFEVYVVVSHVRAHPSNMLAASSHACSFCFLVLVCFGIYNHLLVVSFAGHVH